MREIAVKVDGITKSFKLPHERADSIKSIFAHPFRKRRAVETQQALKDISFDIKKGEFFGIVGRNGSGKSTLLKMIAKIYQPTKGSITVNGRLVPFIELGVGFNPELTGRENVFLNGALMGFSHTEITMKYDSIVEFAEIERFMDQKLKNYSSGMQVRLAFSVATVLAESEVLLIDEVLAVGDAEFQRKCFDYFRALKKQGKTVVFVTHDMNAVIEYCDRAIMIEGGRLVKSGKPEDIANAYKKLFQRETAGLSEKREDSKRWGDKAIKLLNPRLSKKNIDDDRSIELVFSTKANLSINNPIIGFSVVSPTGATIIGINNDIKQQRIKHVEKGEVHEYSWTIPNIFSDGIYYINIDATYNSGTIVADRWENALSFNVDKLEKTPFIASPYIDLRVRPADSENHV